MRKFKDKPSEKYKKAVLAIKELAETESYVDAQLAYAEAVSEFTKQSYAKSRQVKQRKELHVCTTRLRTGKCPDTWEKPCFEPRIPAQDHLTEWTKNGRTESITFEPYGLGDESIKRLLEFCRENNLEFEIRASSWHFPHSTLLVELRRAEEK